jgi:hypothetical protein
MSIFVMTYKWCLNNFVSTCSGLRGAENSVDLGYIIQRDMCCVC